MFLQSSHITDLQPPFPCITSTNANTSTNNSDMFEADAEMSKLKYLPGIDDMTERYRTHVQGVAESYRAAGLANALKKEEEVRRTLTLTLR